MAGRAPRTAIGRAPRRWRVAVVVSRFHPDLTERLLDGAREALRRHGIRDEDVQVVRVPGAFELAQVAARLARTGGVEAIVCLGCVIRGETPHFDFVAGEAARGIAEVGRSTGVPTTFGVVTADTREQAAARSGGEVGNRGEEAAVAALELLRLYHELDGRRRRR